MQSRTIVNSIVLSHESLLKITNLAIPHYFGFGLNLKLPWPRPWPRPRTLLALTLTSDCPGLGHSLEPCVLEPVPALSNDDLTFPNDTSAAVQYTNWATYARVLESTRVPECTRATPSVL